MRKFKRFVKKFFKVLAILFALFIALCLCVVTFFVFKYKDDFKDLSSEADNVISSINNKTFQKRSATKILNSDGEVIREFKHATYKYINYEDIPDEAKETFVSIEDKNFFTHQGIDVKANLRAVKALIDNDGNITQGASTITQQLVKNIFLTNDRTYQRKFKEMMVAYKLEKALTKEQILEYYLNNIYFGNGAYGIETASLEYFSKSVAELGLSEISFLTAIPNNPTLYDPIKNKENTMKRRNRILNGMLLDGKITDVKKEQVTKQEVILNIKEKDKYLPESYEVSFLMGSATKLAMEFDGFELEFAFKTDEDRKLYDEKFNEKFKEKNEDIRMGGYEIVSTIQKDKQEKLQQSIDKGLSNFRGTNPETGLYLTQGAGVTIDNNTKEVVAIIGGRSQSGVDNTFNRAYLAYRQPGSIAKPIIAYAPEIDEGMLSSKILTDKEINKGPRNAGRGYSGNVTAREALERSINTIPYDLLVKRGAKHAISYLHKMEFSNIVDRDNNAGLAIGAFTYGATPLEMTGAYATLANNGDYVRPTGISKITFNDELIVYENLKLAKKVYDSGTAYLMTDMLKGVISEEWGTGYGLGFSDMAMAGKTGTTDDSKDGWFAGYTPYYTTSIWVGNDKPKSISGLYGGTYPGKIWSSYMEDIHKGLAIKDFEMPNTISYMYLNPRTGEVSDTKNRNFYQKELIPHKYVKKKLEEKRAREEKARKEKEVREREAKIKEAKRLEAEMKRKQIFLEEYGVTEEVEYGYQNVTKNYLKRATNMRINKAEDYFEAMELLEKAKLSLVDIIIDSDRENLNLSIENEFKALDRKNEEFKTRVLREERERIEEKERQEIYHEEQMKKLKQERENEEKRKVESKNKKDRDKDNALDGFYLDENGFYVKKDKDKDKDKDNSDDNNEEKDDNKSKEDEQKVPDNSGIID